MRLPIQTPLPQSSKYYVNKSDDYIVYWNGIVMPHSMALCMAMEHACGIYPTPEMKTVLEQGYERLYYSNAFNTRAWDSRVEGSPLYPYLKRIMQEHLKKVLEGREARDVLGWFDYNRARKEEINV